MNNINDKTPLFKVKTFLNFNEYSKMAMEISKKRYTLIGVLITLLSVLVISLIDDMSILSLILYGTFLICILFFAVKLILNIRIKKYYKSSKLIRNTEVKYYFYDTYFEIESVDAKGKYNYQDMYGIRKTNTNIYILTSTNSACILPNNDSTKGLYDFILSKGIIKK